MAILGDIQKRAGLLIGVIGFSLAAFILGELISSRSFFSSGNVKGVAVIKGKNIDPREYDIKTRELEDNFKLNNETNTIDQTTRDQIQEQAWNEMLSEKILGDQYDKLGIFVSDRELLEMTTGNNVHPQVKQAFTNPQTGQFDKNTVIQYINTLDQQDPKSKAQWLGFEKAIMKERTKQKYENLIGKSIYINKHELKEDFKYKNSSANVIIAKADYSSINDAEVEISDSDLQAVYEENKLNYKQEASCKLEYVQFDVIPSSKDREEASDYINSRVEAFKNAENDSVFVLINSDSRFDNNFYKKGTLFPAIDEVAFAGAVGDFVAPFEENGFFKMAKIYDVINFPDSVKANHILIAYAGAERANPNVTRSPQEAQTLADSLYTVIKENKGLYDNIARTMSDGPTRTKGGDLGWFKENMMAPPFNDFCFTNKKGQLGLVQTTFGFHIIEIINQGGGEKRVKMAIVDREIKIGQKTRNSIYQLATKFAGENNTSEKFNQAATDNNIAIRTAPNVKERDKNLPGLTNIRKLIRWAFEAEIGAVSTVVDADEAYVVAKLVERIDNGIPPLEQIKPVVQAEAVKKKKAEMLIAKANESTSVEQFAQTFSVKIDSLQNLNFSSPFVAGIGSEPNVVGVISSLSTGQTSKPIQGNTGIFIARVLNRKDAPEHTNFIGVKQQMAQAMNQRAKFELFNALKESANVTDNRGKLY